MGASRRSRFLLTTAVVGTIALGAAQHTATATTLSHVRAMTYSSVSTPTPEAQRPDAGAVTTATADGATAPTRLAPDGVVPDDAAPAADGGSNPLGAVTGLVSGLVSTLTGVVGGLTGLVSGLLKGLLG
ncbi:MULTISPECIES: hypothetical protein [unclassified Streptomyces]|uniref:Secreted protein n=1 Tax=Streptomyces sp. NBC_00060 TaxID=2975636 RepID=A0AAU2GRN6_9ACTN